MTPPASSAKPAVLLVSPGILRWSDQDFGLPHLVSIGGYLERELGVRVELLDLGYEGGDHRALAETIASLGPFVLIGLSAYSSFDYPRVMSVARFLKALHPDVPLVGGGYHASALPGDVVFEGSPFDAVVVGEGERPLADIVRTLLGGERLDKTIYGPDLVQELDTLPPYRWDLLRRYWPRAHDIGRKFQIYLSRGCPYHCTFCMERSKSGYKWRAYSADRALDELKRLATFTDLGRWVVNVADPLFGFNRRWRREVLEGIAREGLLPRQYWTLTRSDDLDDTDVALLAAARFSIGIGLESGSPELLRVMQKGNEPGAYLSALLRLADLSRKHGLSWAANVIIGHPGETPATMRETHAYLERLYLSAPETCGWLSVDPFRLYPGADVFERIGTYEARFGAKFHHPRWWTHWYDGPFHAQHIDPSRELDYEGRVRFMYDTYAPLVTEVQARFRGQGRSIDRVFARSLEEQREQFSPAMRDRLLATAKRARTEAVRRESAGTSEPPEPLAHRPIGLQLRDPWVRRREEAVRRLLETGVLRSERVVEALLEVAPERFLPAEEAEAMLLDRARPPAREGEAPWAVPIRILVTGLEALGLGAGDRAADLAARGGYVAALLAELVGAAGEVVAVAPGVSTRALAASLADRANVRVKGRAPAAPWRLDGLFEGTSEGTREGTCDGVWLGAALPRAPRAFRDLLVEGGVAITALGPRFRAQDLVRLTRHGDTLEEHRLGRVDLPVLGGFGGWIPAPPQDADLPALSVEAWRGPAAAFAVFARLDLGRDAASCFDPALPAPPWAPELAAAWHAAPGRLALVGEALRHVEPAELARVLRHGPPAPLRDDLGRALAVAFADALDTLDVPVVADVPAPAPTLAADLTHLRGLLWEAQPGPPPPLVVLDCRALGPRGRACTWEGRRRIAVSLGEPAEHVVMQVLHEDIHALTDPHVWAGRDATARDTRLDTPGFTLHQELEQVALAATDAFLRAKAPGWMPAFERWSARLA
ncbi:MAG: radical SAM protein [Pseudomonadota bacterium]|nr:radical SAM protein [Pseudomonadota bacterium]